MNKQQTEGTNSLVNMYSTKHFINPDLKAFENRLTECVTYASKRTLKWKGNGCSMISEYCYKTCPCSFVDWCIYIDYDVFLVVDTR